jgi:DNA-binding GntR family transcriptional regulator
MTDMQAKPENPAIALSRQAFLALRERIILGHYPQGSRLSEQRLAAELGVSRVPLREALPHLEIEGFVTADPRRSAVVRRWDEKAVNDLFDLRLCFEVGAAGSAARRVAAGGSLAPLDTTLDTARQLVPAAQPLDIAEASTRFHEAIVAVADNKLMESVMRLVSGRMMWLFYLTSSLDPEQALQEHIQLRDAIASGKERVAESLAYAHIEHDREPTFRALARRDDMTLEAEAPGRRRRSGTLGVVPAGTPQLASLAAEPRDARTVRDGHPQ